MRVARPPVVALLVLALPALTAAQGRPLETEVVTGFHGYPWGTRVENIAELAGREQVGERDGYRIYSAQVNVMGRPGLAGFYFHPETGELLEGAYVFALTVQSCEWAWATVTRNIRDAYPTLERTDHLPTRGDAPDRQIYDSDCEYFAFNSHKETWTSDYVNKGPPGDRVLLWMKTVERVPRLTVVYRGGRSQAWIESREGG